MLRNIKSHDVAFIIMVISFIRLVADTITGKETGYSQICLSISISALLIINAIKGK